MLVKLIARVVVAINANSRPGEIAFGATLGLLLALVPGGNLLWAALFFVTWLLKINLAAELLFLALFKLLAPLADGLLDRLGEAVLGLPWLQGFFTTLYNLPLVPFTRFNNTVVIGGLVAGLGLLIPVFFLVRALVVLYRRTLRDRIAQSRLGRAIRRVPLFAAVGRAAEKLGGAALSVR